MSGVSLFVSGPSPSCSPGCTAIVARPIPVLVPRPGFHRAPPTMPRPVSGGRPLLDFPEQDCLCPWPRPVLKSPTSYPLPPTRVLLRVELVSAPTYWRLPPKCGPRTPCRPSAPSRFHPCVSPVPPAPAFPWCLKPMFFRQSQIATVPSGSLLLLDS